MSNRIGGRRLCARAGSFVLSALLVMSLLADASAAAAATSQNRAIDQTLQRSLSLSLSQVSATAVCPPAPAGYVTCQAQVLRRRSTGALVRPQIRRQRLEQIALASSDRRLSAGESPLVASAEQPAQSPPTVGTPGWLQQAYDLTGLSAVAGVGDTVAITDAYDDPSAESDLDVFRSTYGLPACTTGNGCFEKVNERGQTSPLPPSDQAGWNVEETLDLDAVSSLCPNCHILLVEASTDGWWDLLRAMQTGVRMGAGQLSDSWSASSPVPLAGTVTWSGVATIAATGDGGYAGPGADDYPAAAAGVTAVGGTSLAPAPTPRGFSETAWSGSGSGCDVNFARPPYQPADGCSGRAWADVSADADPATGLLIYDTGDGGWLAVGGTSLAAPLVAAYEAVTAVNGSTPQWAYSDAGSLNDPASGSNGSCASSISYICNAGVGYDGPTGAGAISGQVSSGPPGIGAPDLSSASGNTYAQSAGSSSAQLEAGIYPNGYETTYWWQYGTSTAYGQQTAPAILAAGTTPVQVSSTLNGLSPLTAYHYRLAAQNTAGTTYGYDYTLQTAAGASPSSTTAPAVSGIAAQGSVLTAAPVNTTPPSISPAPTRGAAIASAAPVNTIAPRITGIAQRLGRLTVKVGSWIPAAAIYRYQWQRCSSARGRCVSIRGATGSSYSPQLADLGLMLEVQVVAVNAHGRDPASSGRVGPVKSKRSQRRSRARTSRLKSSKLTA
jgi:hypothetical protein